MSDIFPVTLGFIPYTPTTSNKRVNILTKKGSWSIGTPHTSPTSSYWVTNLTINNGGVPTSMDPPDFTSNKKELISSTKGESYFPSPDSMPYCRVDIYTVNFSS